MRILQIVPSISLVYGGPSQMVLGLSAALAAKGIEVTILTTDANGDAGQMPLDVPLNQPIAQDGYQIRYFRCSPFRRYKFSLGLLYWLHQHAAEFDLAHIHALFSPVSSLAAALARYHRLPYILRPLGTLDPADLRKKKRLKQLYAALLERANLAGAAAIHFTSQQEAKISQRFGAATQDLVISLGVNGVRGNTDDKNDSDFTDESRGKEEGRSNEAQPYFPQFLGPNHQSPIILFMSRIEPKKGLNLLIPALESLLAEGIPFQFVLAGSNPQDSYYEAKIREQIQQSSLVQCTTLTGFVTGVAKTALLQNADIFVLPSYYENFGIAVAEAMAAGIPVIISDQVHIWQEVENAKAGWVGSCNVIAMTELIKAALLDQKERKKRGLNGKVYAEKYYSWDAISHQMILAYQRILANP